MRYSDDIIEEVRQKNDIVDVVSQYVKLTRKGSSYFGLCPFHNEKTPSFSVTPGKQMYYCFGCGAGGNVFNFIMEYENYTFGEALKHLADRAGVELPKIEYSREVRRHRSVQNFWRSTSRPRSISTISSVQRRARRGISTLQGAGSVRRRCVSSGLGIRTNSAEDCISSLSPRATVMTGFGNPGFLMWTSVMVCMISSGIV